MIVQDRTYLSPYKALSACS